MSSGGEGGREAILYKISPPDATIMCLLAQVDLAAAAESGTPHRSRPLAWLRVPWAQLPADRTGSQELVQGVHLKDPAGQGEGGWVRCT